MLMGKHNRSVNLMLKFVNHSHKTRCKKEKDCRNLRKIIKLNLHWNMTS